MHINYSLLSNDTFFSIILQMQFDRWKKRQKDKKNASELCPLARYYQFQIKNSFKIDLFVFKTNYKA